MSNKLIVILGPTASGKTDLAIKLARKFNGEIVCADSRQIYKGMLIGTASPLHFQSQSLRGMSLRGMIPRKDYGGSSPALFPALLNRVKHHLFSFVSPKKRFSVAQYQKLAIKIIENIQKQGKIPFLVGGTGLYIQAVVDNLQIPKVKPNKILRCQLEKQTEKELFEILKKLDPQTAKVIDAKNKRRLVRALEVCLSGKKFSQKDKGKPLFDVLQIGLEISKEKLRQNIEKRVKQMVKQGLKKEVENLVKKYGWTSILKNTIGYAEWKDAERKELNSFQTGRSLTPSEEKKRLKALIFLHTCQFAKRQLTWFKKNKKIKWTKTQRQAEQKIKNFLKI